MLWGVDYAHQVWHKAVGTARKNVDDDKRVWWDEVVPATANLVNLDVGRDGRVLGVASDGTVYWREGIRQRANEEDNQHYYGTGWSALSNPVVVAGTEENVTEGVAS